MGVGLAVLSSSGCAPAIGAGLGAGLLTTTALTAGCYDPVSVKVVDSVTGLPDCGASVTAREKEGAQARFSSCFYADLSVGTWTVQAARDGYRPASTELVVPKTRRCEPAPQSIELSLSPVDQPPPAGVPIRPLRPGEAPLTPGSLPPPGSLGADAPGGPPAVGSPAPATSSAPVSPPPELEQPLQGEPPGTPGTAPGSNSPAPPANPPSSPAPAPQHTSPPQ